MRPRSLNGRSGEPKIPSCRDTAYDKSITKNINFKINQKLKAWSL